MRAGDAPQPHAPALARRRALLQATQLRAPPGLLLLRRERRLLLGVATRAALPAPRAAAVLCVAAVQQDVIRGLYRLEAHIRVLRVAHVRVMPGRTQPVRGATHMCARSGSAGAPQRQPAERLLDGGLIAPWLDAQHAMRVAQRARLRKKQTRSKSARPHVEPRTRRTGANTGGRRPARTRCERARPSRPSGARLSRAAAGAVVVILPRRAAARCLHGWAYACRISGTAVAHCAHRGGVGPSAAPESVLLFSPSLFVCASARAPSGGRRALTRRTAAVCYIGS
jgi:hypothetical protein